MKVEQNGYRIREGLLLTQSPTSPAERTQEKRRIRKHQVLDCIRRHGPIARTEIARVLAFNLPSVSNLVDELVSEGLATEDAAKKTPLGRRPIPVVLNSSAACVMGVDVGKSATIGLLMNLGGTILGRQESSTPQGMTMEEQGVWVSRFARELLDAQSDTIPPLAGIGIGLPGVLHRPDRVNSLLAPEAEAVRSEVEKAIGVTVLVENDARMMAHGVLWFKRSQEWKTFAVLNLGVGLGMGMVIDRDVFTGFAGNAGEIGHLPLGQPGLPCYCGAQGCLENIVSGVGLERLAREAGLTLDGEAPSARELATMAREGNPGALKVWATFADGLARGIGVIISLFNPQAVILTGRIGQSADLFLDEVRAQLHKYSLPAMTEGTQLMVSELRENAGPLGTCACVMQHIFSASHIPIESIV